MTWAQTEAQKRIYTILSTDVALQTLLGGTVGDPKIYDFVPDNSPYPYVKINFLPFGDRGNHTGQGWGVKVQVDTFYRGASRGNLPVQGLQAEIHRLLHEQDLGVAGWDTVCLRCDFTDILTEDDNVTKHGIQVFNLLLGEVVT